MAIDLTLRSEKSSVLTTSEMDGNFQKLQDAVNEINGIKNLKTTNLTIQRVVGFYADSTTGGGDFIWKADLGKANHNGGTIIAPEALAAWDGTSTNINTLLNWTGSGNGCFVRILTDKRLYPEYFGAIPDATTDCSKPIKKAVYVVTTSGIFQQDGDPSGELVFNSGVYRITETGVFTQTSDGKRAGITFTGAGAYNTLIWLDPVNIIGAGWFYDNLNTVRSWNCTFKHMGFTGGNTWRNLDTDYSNYNNKIKGFRFAGPDWESGHVFENCLFAFLETILEAAGTNNADTIRFTNCTAIKCKTANYINNPQSMSITWFQCYLSNHFGDFAKWGSGVLGAGDLNFSGGAIIFTPDDHGGGNAYILNMQEGAPTAGNACVYINGRFELRGVGSKICAIGNAVGSPIINFDSSTFLNTTTTNRKVVSVGDYADLNFNNSSFMLTTANCEFEIVSSGRRAKQGTIKFNNSFLDDIEKFKFTFPNDKGYVEVSDCWDRLPEYADPSLVKSINGIYSGSDLNANLGNRPYKEYHVNPLNGNALPFRLTNECTLLLPAGAIVTRIYIVLPPNSTSAEAVNYRLFVGNNAKTIVYAQSTTGLQTAGFVLNTDVAIKLGTTLADRTLRLWADDGAGGAGFAGVVSPLICNIYYQ